jgi:hypothetical protein
MTARLRGLAALAVLLFLGGAGLANDSFADLLKRVPSQANAVLVVDVPALHDSPAGKKEGWAKKHQEDYLAHVARIPPVVQRFLIAAQVNPSTLETEWRVGLFAARAPVVPSLIAQKVGGTVDEVGGQSVVVSPQNSFVVSLDPMLIGVRSPLNRQEMARWLRFAKQNKGVVVSPYLQEAATSTSKLAPAIMAIDLADVLDLDGLRKALKGSSALAGQQGDVERVAKLLAGLKGVTCTLRVGNAITGEIRLDCSGPAQPLANVAKLLVLEALGGMGLYIEDLEKWQVRAVGSSAVLSGPLTPPAARQLFSPLLGNTMVHNLHEMTEGGAKAQGKLEQTPPAAGGKLEQTAAAASQRYFRSVNTLLVELDGMKAKSFNQLAGWYAQYAAKIDALPMLNVDPELLNFGQQVAATLRGLCNNSRAALSQQQYQKMNAVEEVVPITYNYTGYAGGSYGNPYYGGGAGWGYNFSLPGVARVNNYGTVNNLMAQTAANEGAIRGQTLKNIADETAKIRRKMTEKYQVEF